MTPSVHSLKTCKSSPLYYNNKFCHIPSIYFSRLSKCTQLQWRPAGIVWCEDVFGYLEVTGRERNIGFAFRPPHMVPHDRPPKLDKHKEVTLYVLYY